MSLHIIEIPGPILIHLVISNLVFIIGGASLDAAFQTTLAALITLPFLVYLYQKDKAYAPEGKKKIPIWVYPLAILAGVLANMVLSNLMEYLKITEQFSNSTQENLLSSDVILQIVGLGVLVPIMEEYLFRGLLYKRLRRSLPAWVAVLAAAGIFALYHGNIVQILFAFPMAVLILCFYEKWQSLMVPIVLHMAVNLSTVVFMKG